MPYFVSACTLVPIKLVRYFFMSLHILCFSHSTLLLKVLSMNLVTLFTLTYAEWISTFGFPGSQTSQRPSRRCVFSNSPSLGKVAVQTNQRSFFFLPTYQDKKFCPLEYFRQYVKLSWNVRSCLISR